MRSDPRRLVWLAAISLAACGGVSASGADAGSGGAPDASLDAQDADAGEPADASQPDAGPQCAPACAEGEVCLQTRCAAVSFVSICDLGRATVLTDGQQADDAVAVAMGQAVAAACGDGFEVATASLSDPAAFDAAQDRLLTPRDELAITAGGFYFNKLVGAWERGRVSPLYFTSDPSEGIGWADSATSLPVHLFAEADVGEAHDFFVMELFPDGDGRLALFVYGVGSAGTQAGGRQVEAVLADPQAWPDAWYLQEWSFDADAGGEGSVLIASGR